MNKEYDPNEVRPAPNREVEVRTKGSKHWSRILIPELVVWEEYDAWRYEEYDAWRYIDFDKYFKIGDIFHTTECQSKLMLCSVGPRYDDMAGNRAKLVWLEGSQKGQCSIGAIDTDGRGMVTKAYFFSVFDSVWKID